MLESSSQNNNKDNNYISINTNQVSEGGKLSGDSDDEDDYSENEYSLKKGKKKSEKPMFLFKVKKLGMKGITHKTRLLLITPEEICYYQMVDKKEKNQKFLNILNRLYLVIKNNEYDLEKNKELLDAFMELPQEEKKIKRSFKNYEIIDLEEYGSFKKAPIKITNLDVQNEEDKLNPINYWIMETGSDFFRKAIMESHKKISNYIEESEYNITNNNEISTKIMTNNIKSQKTDDNIIDLEKGTKLLINNDIHIQKKQKTRNILTADKDKVHYIGIFFQGFVKEYFEHLNKIRKNNIKGMEREKKKSNTEIENEKRIKNENIKKQLYLELAIYYCYNKFVKHCEKVVIKIISDLATFKTNRDILKPGKLHPIVFPNPFSLTQENNAVLLYSIWGINYTLTWNILKGKFNSSLTKTHGKWKGLKKSYKQKNCFQDLLTKLAQICSNTNEFPSIPLSCIIDYNGFRVFCESDIFADEEYLKGLEFVQDEATAFIRELTKYISENNGDIEKGYPRGNNFCNISNQIIADEKSLDFQQSLEGILKDFLNSFSSGKVGEINNDKFDRTEEQMINIGKNLISDSNIIEDSEETFSSYFNETIKKQSQYEFFYLMNFDISVPILDDKIILENEYYKNNKIFYREELFINNINFEKYQENLEKEYINENKIITESDEEEEKEVNINESEEELNEEEDSEDINQENELNEIDLDYKLEENENSKNRFLEIISKNTFQNNTLIESDLSKLFQAKFQSLLMALDSLYLIPFNSETLKMCFHYFGINLCYLGKIAERSTVPHIRELCLIEMFARVSKKIIFDLLAQNSFEKATNAFYSNVKKILGNKYLIPFSFKENYGGDYLTMSTLPIEDVKFLYYDGIELKGLYLQNDEYPFKDIGDDNPINNHENNDEKYDNNYANKNENVLNFFNLLLGNNLINNNKLIIYDKEINNTKELWDFIINEIRNKYNIEDEDVFIYCNLDSISIRPLICAIQYHTGITFNEVLNHKYSRTIFEEFYISPKISYNNFSYFLCKENTILPLANNFGMHYPGRKIYYQAKLNYYAEQYLFRKRIQQNYLYLFYLKILKGWDTYDTKKMSGGGSSSHNSKKEFNKNMALSDISQDQLPTFFEENFITFIKIILSQYQPKYQKNIKKANQSLNKIDNNNLINACERIISIYWNSKHPFMSIFYSTYAKALYKNTNNRNDENKINLFFFKATDIARDSLGELNIFYGKLTRDIGLFCEKNLCFKEAHQMFGYAFKVFSKHRINFKIEYFYSLKHLTKNCVNLGQLKDGLEYGIQLVEEIIKEKPNLLDLIRNEEIIPDINIDEDKNFNEKYEYYFWNKIHNMDGFTFNLVKIAKYLGEYDSGVKLGNILFKIIVKISDNPVEYIFKNYKNWIKFSQKRISDLNDLKNKQNNNKNEFQTKNEIKVKDYGTIKEKSVDNFINAYLKCLFRGLKGIENKVLARAYIGFIENCKEPSLLNASKNQIDELFYKLFFRDNGETFEEHFKNKILYFLLQKYKSGNINSVEIQKNYMISKNELEIIYFKFPKGESKLFDM